MEVSECATLWAGDRYPFTVPIREDDMLKGNSGMGMHKHGTCGCHGKSKRKSPKFLHWAKREAEKNEKKRKPSQMYNRVSETFKNFKPV